MTRKEKIKAEGERIKKVEKWQSRLHKLSKKGISQNRFCMLHGLDAAKFSRNKNLDMIPSEVTVEKVESAFKKEGV